MKSERQIRADIRCVSRAMRQALERYVVQVLGVAYVEQLKIVENGSTARDTYLLNTGGGTQRIDFDYILRLFPGDNASALFDQLAATPLHRSVHAMRSFRQGGCLLQPIATLDIAAARKDVSHFIRYDYDISNDHINNGSPFRLELSLRVCSEVYQERYEVQMRKLREYLGLTETDARWLKCCEAVSSEIRTFKSLLKDHNLYKRAVSSMAAEQLIVQSRRKDGSGGTKPLDIVTAGTLRDALAWIRLASNKSEFRLYNIKESRSDRLHLQDMDAEDWNTLRELARGGVEDDGLAE